ncbi:peptidyl-prolyl cis-trans isomerase [Blastocystis sp. subtype 4]|uniref:peptidyl-prolyl cis-trans isomerase n=1 Tax=Blastocystis sp. subtype 4 TaxID=944170 RepID=UPI0007116EF9|nr:peptidyl-prolyl cis-trans isomerase [Blastocystis sp. subtype 4]KNB46777.1 peptidyl-prolyl cis-trans isomerase [Blastocystis sp. subtype 4]|eukprot:XP_014530202.1 peptidyl-prolyl cis-trans isomerase [Blastocystis sp. subtype 4]
MSNRKTLYVDEEVDEKILLAAFIPFGEVKEVTIPLDAGTGKKRGFGFVEFEEADDAAEARDNMNNAELFGKVINVGYSKQMKAQLISTKPIWAQIDLMDELNKNNATEEKKEEPAESDKTQ